MFKHLSAAFEIGALVSVLLIGAWIGNMVAARRHEKQDEANVARFRTQQKLNDSTSVLLAAKDVKISELEGLVTASKQLNGSLVAGIKVHLRGDSVHHTVELVPVAGDQDTPAQADTPASRQMAFHDSSTAGVLTGTVTINPPPMKDSLAYIFVPNELTPSIGFEKLGNRYVAVVSCSNCKSVRMDAPFVDDAPIKAAPRVTKTVEALWNPSTSKWTADAALGVRLLGGVSAVGQLSRTFDLGQSTQVLFGFAKTF